MLLTFYVFYDNYNSVSLFWKELSKFAYYLQWSLLFTTHKRASPFKFETQFVRFGIKSRASSLNCPQLVFCDVLGAVHEWCCTKAADRYTKNHLCTRVFERPIIHLFEERQLNMWTLTLENRSMLARLIPTYNALF